MSEEKSSNMFSNAKLSTIFMVVLGLHVVVIVLISAYHLLKGDTSVEMAQRVSPPEPRSYESILADDADERSPEVVTAYDGSDLSTGVVQSDQPSLPMSMPAADDPIWTGQAPVRNDVAAEVASMQQEVQTSVESVQHAANDATAFRPSPMVVEEVAKVNEVVSRAVTATGASYTVKRGDTLSGIASRHGVKVSAIQQANQLDSSMIRIGQELKLPGVTSITAPKASVAAVVKPTTATTAPKATVVSTGSYKVSQGDTLWKISRKFSTTPQTIAQMNGITDPSKLRVGETLKVPANSSSASARPVESSTDMAMVPTR